MNPYPTLFADHFMKPLHTLVLLCFAALLLAPSLTRAADDHGHDHGPAPAATGPALPRFAAVSDVFELVGVLNGKQLTLYLDRAADNIPVTDAQIELEIAGKKFKAVKHGDDEFEVMLAEAPKPGVLSITATVVAGKDTDLLAGELDLHDEAPHSDEAAHVHAWTEYAGWAAGAVAVLALLFFVGRRVMASRRPRYGSAA
jgi:hypothetical protein